MPNEKTKVVNRPLSARFAIFSHQLNFFVYTTITIFLVVGFFYPLLSGWDHYWQVVPAKKWVLFPIVVFLFVNCCWRAYTTSYELKIDGGVLSVRRPWGQLRTYRADEVSRVLVLSHRTSLIQIGMKNWIPLTGLNQDGLSRKAIIEGSLRKHDRTAPTK